jgi:hypothetical protein
VVAIEASRRRAIPYTTSKDYFSHVSIAEKHMPSHDYSRALRETQEQGIAILCTLALTVKSCGSQVLCALGDASRRHTSYSCVCSRMGVTVTTNVHRVRDEDYEDYWERKFQKWVTYHQVPRTERR